MKYKRSKKGNFRAKKNSKEISKKWTTKRNYWSIKSYKKSKTDNSKESWLWLRLFLIRKGSKNRGKYKERKNKAGWSNNARTNIRKKS